MTNALTTQDQADLLRIARSAIEKTILNQPIEVIDTSVLSPQITGPGASFVTLTIQGELRGCIGSIIAEFPLYEDICRHAIDAAINDYRFHPVDAAELNKLNIEISVLTPMQPVTYQTPQELLQILRPEIDGVLIRSGHQKATFLPQVWEKIPVATEFLSVLCQKAMLPSNAWQTMNLEVFTYQVAHFNEAGLFPDPTGDH